jgi:hypothetical protein
MLTRRLKLQCRDSKNGLVKNGDMMAPRPAGLTVAPLVALRLPYRSNRQGVLPIVPKVQVLSRTKKLLNGLLYCIKKSFFPMTNLQLSVFQL